MSIKRTLLLLSGTGSDAGAAAAAFLVADRFSAHVDGLHLTGDFIDTMPYIEGSMSESQMAREFTRAREQQAATETSARTVFDEAAKQVGATQGEGTAAASGPTAAWRVESGRVVDILSQRARVYDLTIVSPFGEYPGASSGEVVGCALFETGRPVLVTPKEAPASLGQKVLIGWNRGAQAARAAAFALPFLEVADSVTVAYVQTGAKPGPGPEELCANLACHGVQAQAQEIDQQEGSVAANLAAAAKDMGADLLVMGAYSHSRLREMVLGGVTDETLGHLEIPVLMAH